MMKTNIIFIKKILNNLNHALILFIDMNIKKIIIICFSIGIINNIYSEETRPYDVSNIPAELLSNADAVIRTNEVVYECTNKNRYVFHYKTAITLLNKNVDNERIVRIYYNKTFEKVSNIRAAYYNKKGKLIDRISYLTDVYDIGVTSYKEYSDFRMKVFEIPKTKFPFTIEYEYELDTDIAFNNPEIAFQPSPNISVEKSILQVIFPIDVQFRRYEKNIKNQPDSIVKGNKKIYTWMVEKLPAYKIEVYSEPFYKRVPCVYVTPIEFKIDKYEGDFKSWVSFGKFLYKLIDGRDVLLPDQIEEVKKVINGITDDKEKVIALYKYFQSRTRYLYVHTGIENWQPSFAYEVAKRGYGDCKDLSNYMKAILKTVGINSYYSIIKSGNNRDIISDFTSNQFDHIILCVPLKNDTMWLECTSQTNPAGFLGSFTDNRYALMINEDGGKLVRTKTYDYKSNYLSTKANIDIDIFGNASADISILFYGKYYERVSDFTNLTQNDKKEVLNYYLLLPSIVFNKIDYSDNKDLIPSAKITANINIYNISSIKSRQLIFSPGIITKFNYIPEGLKNLNVYQDFAHYDTIVYSYPSGFRPQFLPQAQKIDNKYGYFDYRVENKNDKIYFYRILILYRGKYEDSTKEAENFINSIAQIDNSYVILSNE